MLRAMKNKRLTRMGYSTSQPDASCRFVERRALIRSVILASALLIVVCADSLSLFAAEAKVLRVIGVGKVEALPDRVELSGTVAGEAELAADAVKQYREHRRRVVEALEALKLKGLAISGNGMSITTGTDGANPQQALVLGIGNQNAAAPAKISVRETLTVTLDGVQSLKSEELLDTVIKLIDSAKDAGLTIGPKPLSMIEIQFSGASPTALVRFRLNEIDAYRQNAYTKAMENARASAERLAKLANVKLGKIVSIHEGPAPPSPSSSSSSSAYATYVRSIIGASHDTAETDYSSNSFQQIPIGVTLEVDFEIE